MGVAQEGMEVQEEAAACMSPPSPEVLLFVSHFITSPQPIQVLG